ncbi:transglycosylase SLT domain-containing protein [Streptomyces sp. NPDC127098]|uniref:aggregation-promoting factor C-terminal-like domain-containing protein n=1 Tax=Streptomyces sp. NPDC127098 TaxID=3347137 RepID=UPI00366878F6
MSEGNRVTGISVRGFAVASATAVTSVGAVVGVASGDEQGAAAEGLEVVPASATLLSEIPAGTNAQLHTASLTQQAEVQSVAADAEARIAAQEAARIQAAEDATERRAAEEREAQERAEREAAEAAAEAQSASASADYAVQSSYSVAEIQQMAREIVGADQFQCFSNIVDHESDWNYQATNPSSGAYGLMQALPGSKMASAGADWQTNPATQIRWGLNYMNDRYGSPCGAWDFWTVNNWY